MIGWEARVRTVLEALKRGQPIDMTQCVRCRMPLRASEVEEDNVIPVCFACADAVTRELKETPLWT